MSFYCTYLSLLCLLPWLMCSVVLRCLVSIQLPQQIQQLRASLDEVQVTMHHLTNGYKDIQNSTQRFTVIKDSNRCQTSLIWSTSLSSSAISRSALARFSFSTAICNKHRDDKGAWLLGVVTLQEALDWYCSEYCCTLFDCSTSLSNSWVSSVIYVRQ